MRNQTCVNIELNNIELSTLNVLIAPEQKGKKRIFFKEIFLFPLSFNDIFFLPMGNLFRTGNSSGIVGDAFSGCRWPL